MKLNDQMKNMQQRQWEKIRDAWGNGEFPGLVKKMIESLDESQLPLQQGLAYSSVATTDNLTATILNSSERAGTIKVKLGIGYSGIIAGCACSDDPSPPALLPEYCEVMLSIDRASAKVTIEWLPD